MSLIDKLEREGGHVLVLLLLVLLGTVIFLFTQAHNERILDGALGALLLAMKGNGNKPPETKI